MHHRYDDLQRLVGAVPFMALMRPGSALSLLTRAADDAEELASVLGQYPQVRYQALDFHYVCLQSLGALSKALIEDLASEFGWRGLVWASILACLAPSEDFREALEAARLNEPRKAWAVDLALAHLDAECPSELSGLMAQLIRLRHALSACTVPSVSLRLAESRSVIDARQSLVREKYQCEVNASALQAIRRAER
ncbi:hypothetical protein ACQ86G_24960 [Roseateles chitinivorans]|uniref:hypothetical protein n=1 Tax=Roseateles chitinivorans TaxID=2917965 RepID=UPI003D66DCC4